MKLKTIDKFVLKAYIGPMFATFFIVSFILMMNGLWIYIDDIVGKGLPFTKVLELMFYYSSTMIPLGLPLATLLAALMTMGNMGENYELLAFKSAGISLVRIIRSTFLLAIAISISSFFIINNYVPYSFNKMGEILSDIGSLRQEIELTNGVFFNGIPNISIRVQDQNKSTDKLYDVLIYDNRDRNMSKTIIADSGYIAMTPDRKFMKIDLYSGQNLEDNRNYRWDTEPSLRTNTFKYQMLTVKLDGFSLEDNDNNIYEGRSNTKNIFELQLDIDSLSNEADLDIVKFKSKFLRNYLYRNDTTILVNQEKDSLIIKKFKNRSKFSITKRTIDTLTIEQKKDIYDDAASRMQSLKFYSDGGHSQVTSSTINLYRSKIDWHKKISLPVSVFVFFLIGAPLGAIIRRGGLGLPVVICIIFFLVYYILNMIGERLVGEGVYVPAVGMWLSTFVLGPIAIFLTIKSKKDSQLLNIELYMDKYKKVKKFILKKIIRK